MRLIDADTLMPDAEHKGRYDVVTAYDIANAPTIDAVEVVRCKDCQFSCTPEWDSDEVFCTKNDNWFKINGYCHLGRRWTKMNWYEKRVKEIGYKGCRNCVHQLAPLRGCEWLEHGGDGVLHLICPRWERKL